MTNTSHSYPDFSSSILGEDSTSSLNTLRLALISLKERCHRQQQRIDELETENSLVRKSREELYQEIHKLHETNMRLREKNLQLNQKLTQQSKENVLVKEQVNSLQYQHSNSIRQLERLQNEVLSSPNKSSSSFLAFLTSQSAEKENANLDELDEDSLVQSQMLDIKTKLLEQQTLLKASVSELSEQLKNRRPMSDCDNFNSVSSKPHPTEDGTKKCPMCEATFESSVSQDVFEGHVVEHFNYEESETLKNYDVVADAIGMF